MKIDIQVSYCNNLLWYNRNNMFTRLLKIALSQPVEGGGGWRFTGLSHTGRDWFLELFQSNKNFWKMGGKISQREWSPCGVCRCKKIKIVNLLNLIGDGSVRPPATFSAAGAKASDGLETIFLWFISMGRPKRACRQAAWISGSKSRSGEPGSL